MEEELLLIKRHLKLFLLLNRRELLVHSRAAAGTAAMLLLPFSCSHTSAVPGSGNV